ncbi:LCP family protein [Streptomyces sp. NPDC048389]|uniref:LCP family protein n=1 Tax=Streptomyces sp. NPDC048389 TaxID=3154622 RepID=UPI0034556346
MTDKAGTGPAGSAAADENANPEHAAAPGAAMGTGGATGADEVGTASAVADGDATPADRAASASSGDGPADATAGDTPGGAAAGGPGRSGPVDATAGGSTRADGGHGPGDDGPGDGSGADGNGDDGHGHGASGPDGGNGSGPGDGGDGGDGDAGGHGDGDARSPRRPRQLMRWAALGLSLVLLAAAGAGWWFYRKLDANITTDTTAATELKTYEEERPTPVVTGAQNILLLGSDTRAGEGNDKYGRDEGGGGSQRSDTTILLHIAADRKSATAMSIPRDLVVTIPSCGKGDGERTKEQVAQFNWAFQFGGAACTIRTVEKFTGIRIDHHMVIDFQGFKDMVDAVDGVEVCLEQPIDDKDARLKLPAGRQTLDGEQALGFVRARKTLGDGSDTERMERQQQFLGALVKKVQSNGVLLNPTRLYPVLDAATKSITTDPGLDSLRDLYDLTRSIRSIPTEKVQFLTVPRQPHSSNPNRDELVQPEAGRLFESLREDDPVTVVPNGEEATVESDAEGTAEPSPTPTFPGTNAAQGMCE